jgi:hypothetical protein
MQRKKHISMRRKKHISMRRKKHISMRHKKHISMRRKKHISMRRKKIGGFGSMDTAPEIPGAGYSNLDPDYNGPIWHTGCTTLVKLPYKETYITSIPNQFNENQLNDQLDYYNSIGILNIISLEGCGIGNLNLRNTIIPNKASCNTTFNDFESTKKHKQHVEGDYWTGDLTNHFFDIPVLDMSAGTYNSWNELYKLSEETENFGQSSLIHCLAGKGRSGIILLFIILIDLLNQNPDFVLKLQQKWFGYTNSYAFYDFLRNLLVLNLILYDDKPEISSDGNIEKSRKINERIKVENIIENIIDEVFKIDSVFSIRLFTARINNILNMLGIIFKRNSVYLYELPFFNSKHNSEKNNVFDKAILNYASIDNEPDNYGISTDHIYVNNSYDNDPLVLIDDNDI